jgi:hypothetical protein
MSFWIDRVAFDLTCVSIILYLETRKLSQGGQDCSLPDGGANRPADETEVEHAETPQRKTKKKVDVRKPDFMEVKVGRYQKFAPKRSYSFEEATNESEQPQIMSHHLKRETQRKSET